MLEGDLKTAKTEFSKGIKYALDAGEPANQLDGILVEASILRVSGDLDGALALASMVHSHPSADPLQKGDSIKVIESLRAELPAEAAGAAVKKGEGLDLQEELNRIVEKYSRPD